MLLLATECILEDHWKKNACASNCWTKRCFAKNDRDAIKRANARSSRAQFRDDFPLMQSSDRFAPLTSIDGDTIGTIGESVEATRQVKFRPLSWPHRQQQWEMMVRGFQSSREGVDDWSWCPHVNEKSSIQTAFVIWGGVFHRWNHSSGGSIGI